ncbi:hypothetical protein BKA25_002529 [Actinoalloteichus hymeniacidonis]|uniref:Uncharacterized protein n=1 Tax=Actinoalloteichus hymeniacidonis TaxID=340345 RepID=A0AAC9MXV4_9PSEU|nr:hypothetical protein TL08_14620 [Actinoalloteichus hymeniacidonis]MBB5908213.1 hypothetical protein [Actinoalloteichus hymeniacidonis]
MEDKGDRMHAPAHRQRHGGRAGDRAGQVGGSAAAALAVIRGLRQRVCAGWPLGFSDLALRRR